MTPFRGAVRVACLSPYPEDGPSVRHRIAAYRPLWAERGIVVDIFAFATGRLYRIRREFGWARYAEKVMWMAFGLARLLVRLGRLSRYDIIIIHREVFPLGPPVFERLVCALNSRVVFDFDDAIWAPPSSRVNQRRAFWDPHRVANIIARSRHVVAGNAFLAEYARQHTSCVTIIPTTYDEPLRRRETPKNPVPVVVWIGNLGNAWYLNRHLQAFERAAQIFPFVLRLVGGADLDEVRSDRLVIDRRPWSEAEERAMSDADIGIMPLPDLEYEQGKCGFKIVQYWSAGLAVIASPVGVNATMITSGVNGLLTESDNDWEQALVACLSDAALRSRLAQGGREAFQKAFTRSAGADAWGRVFDQVLAAERA